MAAAPAPAAEAAPKGGGSKKLIIIIVAVLALVVLGGGAAAVLLMKKGTHAEAGEEGDEEHEAPAEKAKPKEHKADGHPPTFVPLDPFTVNLADEGGERLAQVGIVLELAGKEVHPILTRNMPIVRNNMLLLLSSQHAKTLLSLEGKLALAAQIGARTSAALGWKEDKADPAHSPNPIVAVHFSQMLVQ